jgi:ATP-dependent Lon protease
VDRRSLAPPPAFPAELPVLALRDAVLFPDELVSYAVGRPRALAALRAAGPADGARFVVALAQRRADVDEPRADELYDVGCVARVLATKELEAGLSVRVGGIARVRVEDHVEGRGWPAARVALVGEPLDASPPLDAFLVGYLRELARSLLVHVGWSKADAAEHVACAAGPGRVADLIAGALSLEVAEKQRLLETTDVAARARALLDFGSLRFQEDEPEVEAKAPGLFARMFRW